MKYEEIPLNDNKASHHLELQVDNYTAFIDYKKTNDKLFLIHTEVPDELEGRGVGSAIVEKAFQFAKANEMKIVPLCSFVQSYLKRHPALREQVAEDSDRFMKK
jgi:hypothetical protein